jgi:hypothetical protein
MPIQINAEIGRPLDIVLPINIFAYLEDFRFTLCSCEAIIQTAHVVKSRKNKFPVKNDLINYLQLNSEEIRQNVCSRPIINLYKICANSIQ